MEQVQPLSRPFPWRLATLVASAVALAILAGLVLTHRPVQPRPVSDTGRVPTREAVTPLRPRSRLSVLVLNGNGIPGAAASTAEIVRARGYPVTATADAPTNYPRSVVMYKHGFTREAERLGRDLNLKTHRLLDPLAVPGGTRAQLVVIVGRTNH